jgi:hypothetical protein
MSIVRNPAAMTWMRKIGILATEGLLETDRTILKIMPAKHFPNRRKSEGSLDL